MPWWLGLLLGGGVLFGLLQVAGTPVETAEPPVEEARTPAEA
jgi:hypothetical protein